LNQNVKVLVDSTANTYRTLPGVITFIADKAEFTPKTIQTKDERANLVYAIKIHVKNDGYLKIGMYGEVKFN
jgi:HlyD family secretion protein